MGNEKYFDRNVLMYDQYRPTYGNKVYEDILSACNVNRKSRVLEIGCGTGNATLPFINTGADLVAVEVGENLARYTASKFSDYQNFKIVHIPFEEYRTEDKYDLIYSATAFHWIRNDVGYPRCRELLREDGVLALFWNTPRISDENKVLKRKIQDLYREYLNDGCDDIITEVWYKNRCESFQYMMRLYGYRDLTSRIYFETRVMNADDYVGLLHTYSNHMALPDSPREIFFRKIHDAINEHGSVSIIDTIDLHMGRK